MALSFGFETILFFAALLTFYVTFVNGIVSNKEEMSEFSVEGDVLVNSVKDSAWTMEARIVVDGQAGAVAYLDHSGHFVLHGLEPGVYDVYATHPTLRFTPIQVYVSPKGQKSARRWHVVPWKIKKLPYPLRFRENRHMEFVKHAKGTFFDTGLLLQLLPFILMGLLYFLQKSLTARVEEERVAQQQTLDTTDQSVDQNEYAETMESLWEMMDRFDMSRILTVFFAHFMGPKIPQGYWEKQKREREKKKKVQREKNEKQRQERDTKEKPKTRTRKDKK